MVRKRWWPMSSPSYSQQWCLYGLSDGVGRAGTTRLLFFFLKGERLSDTRIPSQLSDRYLHDTWALPSAQMRKRIKLFSYKFVMAISSRERGVVYSRSAFFVRWSPSPWLYQSVFLFFFLDLLFFFFCISGLQIFTKTFTGEKSYLPIDT